MPTLDTTEQKQAQPPKGKPGRPKKGEERQISNAARFFETLKKIPASAWSEGKAVVKVYRVEPCIDRTASGKPKHIQEYYEPIESEERIKIDHGSGKYLLFVTYQGAKESQMREIERTPIDILDMKYPPKVPRGDWLDEPKNQGWLWAFPKEAPPPAVSPVAELAGTLDLLDGIQDRAAARNKPAETPKAPEQPSTLETLRVLKELLPPPVPPATDNKMLETIVALMNAQLARMSEDNRELRKEIAEARKNPEVKGGALGNLSELVAEASKLGLIPEGGLKSLWGKAEGALQAVTRSRMSGTEEFWQPILVGLFDAIKPALPMVVARMVQPQPQRPQQPQPGETAALPQAQPQPATNGAAAPPPMNGAPPAATTAPDAPQFDQQQALSFFSNFAQAFVKFFEDEQSGGDFAAYIHEGYGADWQGIKWLWLKTQVPAARIIDGFKTTPLWPQIAASEARFAEYVQEFVDWQPAAADTVVDLEEQEQEPVQ